MAANDRSVPTRRPSLHVEPHGLVAVTQHYIRDLVYGANDGVITTFAVVAGVTGRSIQQVNSAAGVAELVTKGMKVYKPTAAELDQFRAAAQPPVLAWLKQQVEPGWTEAVQSAVAEAQKALAN